MSLVGTESSVEAMLGMAHAASGLMSALELFPLGSVELPDPAMAQEFFQGTLTMTVENEGDGLNFLFRAD